MTSPSPLHPEAMRMLVKSEVPITALKLTVPLAERCYEKCPKVTPSTGCFPSTYRSIILSIKISIALRWLKTFFSAPYQKFSFGRLANFQDSFEVISLT